MYYDEYEKQTITKFKGLYKRGLPDECPPDHAICCENVTFTKAGEVSNRQGLSVSTSLAAPSVTRAFLSETPAGFKLLTCDGMGNIYADAGAPIYTAAGMYDFAALNIYNRTYILPIISSFPPTNPPNLQVYNGTYIRDAAGAAPGSGPTAANGAAGNVDAGVYQIAVSFITDTGFVTPPSPLTTYTAPGGDKINLTAIPTGPTGTIGRQILVTRANQLELMFLSSTSGGVINDNVTTTATLNFFDTDLVISADYLNDLLPTIPGSNRTGTLNFYHNRMVILNLSTIVKVSRPQDPESFNQVDGLIQFPEYGINSAMYGVCVQRDILYITKFPGIYAVTDNGLEPVFWPIVLIDGGVGALAPGIGSLSGTDNALTSSETFLLADRNGIFKFDGSIVRPALTWKIDDLWKVINFAGAAQYISIFMDVFHDIFYVLAPVGNATYPNMLLMCDYSEGMDSANVKWSLWTFPYVPSVITIINYEGNAEIGTGGYFLRIGFYNQPYLFAIKPGNTTDIGAAINAYYRTYLVSPSPGALNQFRILVYRVTGTGQLSMTLDSEDFLLANEQTPANFALAAQPAADLTRQINFGLKEKMSVGFGTRSYLGAPNPTDTFTVQRLDIYSKPLVGGRPG